MDHVALLPPSGTRTRVCTYGSDGEKTFHGMLVRLQSSACRADVLVEQTCTNGPIQVQNSPPFGRTLEVQNVLHFPLHFLLDVELGFFAIRI